MDAEAPKRIYGNYRLGGSPTVTNAMRYLVDTNILIYLATDMILISNDVKNIIENYENRIYVSSESIKELIHLLQTGKIKAKAWKQPKDVFDTIEKDLGFFINYVKKPHLETMACLELQPHHNDPSDRLIIAQAITEKIPLISSDRKMQSYKKQGLDFIFNDKS
jgi:PIN domain nuclease of toxin-antitoxin system